MIFKLLNLDEVDERVPAELVLYWTIGFVLLLLLDDCKLLCARNCRVKSRFGWKCCVVANGRRLQRTPPLGPKHLSTDVGRLCGASGSMQPAIWCCWCLDIVGVLNSVWCLMFVFFIVCISFFLFITCLYSNLSIYSIAVGLKSECIRGETRRNDKSTDRAMYDQVELLLIP